jgi:hypothetical protein
MKMFCSEGRRMARGQICVAVFAVGGITRGVVCTKSSLEFLGFVLAVK